MMLEINFPDRFVPIETEFQTYCAVKLLKGNYVTKEEAMNICGFNEINDRNTELFNNLYNTIEKRYKKICGDGYNIDDFINVNN